MRSMVLLASALAVTGCAGTQPQITSPGEGCNVRAGYAVPDGSAGAGFGGLSVVAAGASATIVGECPEHFKTFARGAGGSVVCYGDDAWCESALESEPVQLTPAQLRSLVQPR